jgi:Histidine kinase-, DNA gyrase B-, and HSP90-like ATPase
MKTHEVELSRDHLERQARCSPEAAIEEIIWNGLDAGGNLVEVNFDENEIGGIEAIEVIDRGSGIPFPELSRAFGTLGRSLKLEQKKNSEGRVFHGSEGRGRFKALVLGQFARWETRYRVDGKVLTYAISSSRQTQKNYSTNDQPDEASGSTTGTVVRIEEVDQPSARLRSESVRERLTERLAIYLTNYPAVRVRYDGFYLDPIPLIANRADYELEPTEPDDIPASLSIIEWTHQLSAKKMLLTDLDGFSRHEILAGVPARDISYTAYLKFKEAREWADSGRFLLAELDAEVIRLVDRAKDKLREHVRERLAQEAKDLVQQWKEEKIYPYPDDEPKTIVQKAERQVFDIVASRVNTYHKPFKTGDKDARQLTLYLVRQALESNPTSLKQILDEVLRLPKAQQDELASLLETTSLNGMIIAAKAVRDRLQALAGFDEILFGENWRVRLRERTQLHRLLVHHLWIIGEEYTLDTDDERLRKVLEKHLAHLGRELLAEEKDPKLVTGKDAIPDLMLSRVFDRDRGRLEHLILELKRPSLCLGSKELTQIKQYALAVSRDERFSKSEVQWRFILVGNSWDEFVEQEAKEKSRPYGCVGEHDGYSVWVQQWSDILHEAKQRYRFFSDKLEIEASVDEGVEYLSRHYPDLLSGKGKTKKQEQQLTTSVEGLATEMERSEVDNATVDE